MIFNRRSAIEIIAFVVFFVAIVIFLSTLTYPVRVILGGKVFSVEVADTKELLEKGLSLHAPLSTSQGMLFVFQKPDKYGFWMKGMSFPIDIIWIDSNLKVVDLKKSISPDTYPKVFYPNTPALYVFEISAGQSDFLNVKIGDLVKFWK